MDLSTVKAGWGKLTDWLMPPTDQPVVNGTEEEPVFVDTVDGADANKKRSFGTLISGAFGGKSSATRVETIREVNGGSYTYTEPDDGYEEDEPEPQQPTRPNLVVHEAPKLKVRIYTPTSFDQAAGIADDLRDKRAVVVNYERVETELQRRICDFINGCCYVTDGGVKRVCDTIVLYVPEGVNVSEAMSIAAVK